MSNNASLNNDTFNKEELINFCRLLTSAAKSGLPLVKALDKYKNYHSFKQSYLWINDLIEKLSKGYSIEESTKDLKNFDPILARLMPLLGNERLIKVFEIYTKYMVKQHTCNKQIRFLVWYPLLIMILGLFILIYLNLFNFPNMENLSSFNGFWETWSLKILYFTNPKYWPFSLVVPIFILYLIFDCMFYIISGHFIPFSLWAKLSGIDKAEVLNEKARLVAFLSLYLEAGYTLDASLEAAIPLVDFNNKKELFDLKKSLISGNSLYEALKKSEVLSEVFNGKESNKELSIKMAYAYDYFNSETLSLIKNITDRLFYIPLLLAALIALAIGLGFFGSYNLLLWSVL